MKMATRRSSDLVSAGDMLMGKSYKGPSSQTNEMIYKFTDAVMKELTGKPGIASSQIAFVSQPADKREKEIFITDILGNKQRQVTRHRNLVVSPRFSFDGTYLAYSSYHSGNQNLYITDLRQTKTTRAISKRKGMNLAPAWAKWQSACRNVIQERQPRSVSDYP